MWLALCLAWPVCGAPDLLQNLFFGDSRDALSCCLFGGVLFVAICGPLFWTGADRAGGVLSGALKFLAVTLAPLPFAAAAASRIYPVEWSAALRSAAVFAAYAALAYALFRASDRWYYPVQALLLATGPLCALVLGEMLSVRAKTDVSALTTANPFAAIADALHGETEPPRWLLALGAYALAAAALAVLARRGAHRD